MEVTQQQERSFLNNTIHQSTHGEFFKFIAYDELGGTCCTNKLLFQSWQPNLVVYNLHAHSMFYSVKPHD